MELRSVKPKARDEVWSRRYLMVLRDSAERFASVLDQADLDSAVPSCPGWTLNDLAVHLGRVHRWARHAVIHAEQGPEDHVGPASREALAEWFRQGAKELIEDLEATNPATQTWHFGPKPHTVGFWMRRQAQETTIHAVDALHAAGHPVWDIDQAFAVDGVHEVCEMFYPRQVRLGRMAPLPLTLRFFAGDMPDWSATLHGEGPERAVHASTVAELYLAMWRRAELPGLDPQVATALAAPITP